MVGVQFITSSCAQTFYFKGLVTFSFLSVQVGGHTRMLLLDQGTICKPLNPKELDFYQNIPQDIQTFVPKYKGKF